MKNHVYHKHCAVKAIRAETLIVRLRLISQLYRTLSEHINGAGLSAMSPVVKVPSRTGPVIGMPAERPRNEDSTPEERHLYRRALQPLHFGLDMIAGTTTAYQFTFAGARIALTPHVTVTQCFNV